MSGRELLSPRVYVHWHDREVQPRQAEEHSLRHPERDVRALPRRQRDQDHQHRQARPSQVALQIVSFHIFKYHLEISKIATLKRI